MRSLLGVSGAVAVAAAASAVVLVTAGPVAAADDSFTIKDPRVTESSGLAASRAHPGVYWTHNDSDDGPYIYAVDSKTGQTVARITMTGVGTPRDVEGISVGPDGQVYVGDIGDNLDGSWDHVWIYRFPEPEALGDATVRATQFTVRYADGARNAEALMVHPKTGRVYIASKNEDKGGLYEGPAQLTASGSNTFRRVADVPWVTDGAFSPDGKRLVLRSYFSARTYAWQGDGTLDGGERVDAPLQGQSESVSYTADGTALMFGSEGANSRVVRVAVEGAGAAAGADGGKAPSKDGGSSSAGGGGGAGGGAAADGDGQNLTVGAIALGVATALVLGLKRLLRRR
ncbi:WD40 repeat domain-containing protein [Streptomyces sp. A3M-1-3]|uniref:WD40 repeat domain-containing protein n=1 Tax=Streptomyces sp. A3M-1-3 TaxID=2962044 RepID=UPI0020B68D45|nr:WD40 repeat domain-containing protein [Streptomyces sp. A3M-1-3]MCP3821866.1 WD40 repeat domain-containing protein [Streptomyces sp. A3M-1-3]